MTCFPKDARTGNKWMRMGNAPFMVDIIITMSVALFSGKKICNTKVYMCCVLQNPYSRWWTDSTLCESLHGKIYLQKCILFKGFRQIGFVDMAPSILKNFMITPHQLFIISYSFESVLLLTFRFRPKSAPNPNIIDDIKSYWLHGQSASHGWLSWGQKGVKRVQVALEGAGQWRIANNNKDFSSSMVVQ